MRTLPNIIATLLFAAFLLVPLGSLAVMGPAQEYGQRKFAEYPTHLIDTLHSSSDIRDALTSALFERSPATPLAIRTHNHVLYHYAGYIDTPRIVSGKNGWLFVKSQFWGGECISDKKFANTLMILDTLSAIAAAGGLSLIFTVSPDKVSIHPEQLHWRAAAYVGCRLKNGQRWRKLASEYAPALVDHTTPILRAKKPNTLYHFATDSHWNANSVELAIKQLAAVLDGKAQTRSEKAVVHRQPMRNTDLRNRMLLLDVLEPDNGTIEIQPHINDVRPIIFIRDSFYGIAHAALAKMYPKATHYRIGHDIDKYSTAISQQPGPVVVNTVERNLFGRFQSFHAAGIGSAVLKRNMSQAKLCKFSRGPPLRNVAAFSHLRFRGSQFEATGPNAQITLAVPAMRHTCLRVRLGLEKNAVFKLHLPPLRGRRYDAVFEDARSISLDLPAGNHDLRFILPDDRAIDLLGIDPTDTAMKFTLADVDFGFLP